MLAPCYLIHGGELLQTEEIIQDITNLAIKEGYNKCTVHELTVQFDWEELLNNCRNLDLFAERTLMELRLHSDVVSKKVDVALDSILREQDSSFCIIVRATKLKPQTLNSDWAKRIRKNGKVYLAKPIPTDLWPTWLTKRLANSGFTTSQEALSLIANCYEGNLMAMNQFIKKLTALFPIGKLELEQIKPLLDNNSHYVIFELINAALDGDSKRTLQIFNTIVDDGIELIILLGSITNTVRNLILLQSKLQTGIALEEAARELGIWRENLTRFKKALARLSIEKLEKLLPAAKNIDAMIKGMQVGNAREHLLSMYFILAGIESLIMEDPYI